MTRYRIGGDDLEDVIHDVHDRLEPHEDDEDGPIAFWVKEEGIRNSAITFVVRGALAARMGETSGPVGIMTQDDLESLLAMSFLIGWEAKKLQLRKEAEE